MNEKDFFDVEQNEDEVKQLKGKLAEFAEKVKKLQEGKNDSWEETEIFKKIITIIGEYAPIKLLEDIVSYYNKKKQKIITDELLSIMDEGCISSMILDNGTKLNVKKKLKPNVINEKEFYEWVEKEGYSDFIKDNLEFGKGELNNEILKYLYDNGISFKRKSGIHYQTLTKIFNDREEAGQEFPADNIVKIDVFRYVDVK